jgi:hypothetical protein
MQRACCLELGQCRRHSGTPYAESHREKVVRYRYDPLIEPVTSKQQPSAQPLVQLVTHIAQYGLRILHQKRLNVIHQLLTQFWACLDCIP